MKINLNSKSTFFGAICEYNPSLDSNSLYSIHRSIEYHIIFQFPNGCPPFEVRYKVVCA